MSEAAVEMLASMGFTAAQAKKALIETNGDPDRAVDWLFSHPEETGESAEGGAGGEAPKLPEDKRPGNYKLHGFITHLGTSTACGHYVAHIKKGDDWVLFNDAKVASTSEPPIEKGTIYFFAKH